MQYHTAILGAGPGGVAAAKKLAAAGKKVALIAPELGGECLNYGCIPTKTYLWSCELFEKISGAQTFGIDMPEQKPSLNWEAMKQRKNDVVTKLKRGLKFTLDALHVEIIEGTGRFVDAHTLEISQGTGTQTITAENIIIAAGSQAFFPPGFEKSEKNLSNKEILDLPQIPQTLLIIGAGAVGVEFASVFATLGSRVTIAETGARLLPHEDLEISAELLRIFTRKKITVKTETKITPQQTADFEKVLVAVGRTLSFASLQLEKTDVETEARRIITNEFLQTTAAHIYAIGDIAGKALLAYTAEREGEIAAAHILGKKPQPLNYTTIAHTIFSLPEIASCGKTEDQLKTEGQKYVVGKSNYSVCAKALIVNSRDGFAKVIADSATSALLGIHIIGEKATEMIAEASLALTMGLTLEQFLENLHSHPILDEVLKEAAQSALNANQNTHI